MTGASDEGGARRLRRRRELGDDAFRIDPQQLGMRTREHPQTLGREAGIQTEIGEQAALSSGPREMRRHLGSTLTTRPGAR